MTTRERLYDLIDDLPDEKLDEAEALLEGMTYAPDGRPQFTLEDAPLEDEELTDREKAALARLDRGESDARAYSHDEIQQLMDEAAGR